jgi:hypothetical protein
MSQSSLRAKLVHSSAVQKVLASPFARLAVFPSRAAVAVGASSRATASTTRWLFGSNENTNYTYNLTSINREHLAWFVANLAHIDVAAARGYLDEVLNDPDLVRHVVDATHRDPQRWLADLDIRFGRRIGWYALIRATKPKHVVETGTDKGLGSVVIASALLKNGAGRVTTIDNNPASGYLISGPYAAVTDRVIADSLAALAALDRVDLFLHDSDHSAEHERRELETIAPALTARALVLSDNAHSTQELAHWAELTGRRFTFFDERPLGHWYPGAGIGVAYVSKA